MSAVKPSINHELKAANKKWWTLDCYVGAFHPRQELWNRGDRKPCTAKVYRILKRKKSPLLQYFQINYDATGGELVSVNLPPAFVGLILNQIMENINA